VRVFEVQASSLGYLCAKFSFFRGLRCELAHGEKLRTQSLNHPAYLMPREPKLMLQKI